MLSSAKPIAKFATTRAELWEESNNDLKIYDIAQNVMPANVSAARPPFTFSLYLARYISTKHDNVHRFSSRNVARYYFEKKREPMLLKRRSVLLKGLILARL